VLQRDPRLHQPVREVLAKDPCSAPMQHEPIGSECARQFSQKGCHRVREPRWVRVKGP
jgi:hypothetical protein